MSQHMMFPESEGQQPQQDAEQYKPYYWSSTPENGKSGKTGDIPKNEHPSTFEDTIPPYSYPAQVAPQPQAYTEASKQARQTRQQHTKRQQFSPDGDAFEYGYRPYQNRASYDYAAQQVPHWARPQQHNGRGLRWLVFIILGIVFLQPVLWLVGHLLAVLGILIGVTIFALLLPIIFVLVLAGFIAIFVFGALSALGIGGRRRGQGYRRGPWW